MEALLQFIKDYLIPGSPTFLLLGVVIGVILLYARGRAKKVGHIWLTVLAAGYWILSTPLGAKTIEAGLAHGMDPIKTVEDVEGANAIVVLGGGSINLRTREEVLSLLVSESALRAMEGIRLYKLMEEPFVVISGGSNPFLGEGTPESELMVALFIDQGVPKKDILIESVSQSTREQAQKLKPILAREGIERFVLVTSPIHMRRAIAVFEAHGMEPIPGPSSLLSEVFDVAGIGILPSWVALDSSQAAMREYMALTYYWARGWLRTDTTD
jgi:uncharacterized SAM-binding protein YcdF (DUF218 family)